MVAGNVTCQLGTLPAGAEARLRPPRPPPWRAPVCQRGGSAAAPARCGSDHVWPPSAVTYVSPPFGPEVTTARGRRRRTPPAAGQSVPAAEAAASGGRPMAQPGPGTGARPRPRGPRRSRSRRAPAPDAHALTVPPPRQPSGTSLAIWDAVAPAAPRGTPWCAAAPASVPPQYRRWSAPRDLGPRAARVSAREDFRALRPASPPGTESSVPDIGEPMSSPRASRRGGIDREAPLDGDDRHGPILLVTQVRGVELASAVVICRGGFVSYVTR